MFACDVSRARAIFIVLKVLGFELQNTTQVDFAVEDVRSNFRNITKNDVHYLWTFRLLELTLRISICIPISLCTRFVLGIDLIFTNTINMPS